MTEKGNSVAGAAKEPFVMLEAKGDDKSGQVENQ